MNLLTNDFGTGTGDIITIDQSCGLNGIGLPIAIPALITLASKIKPLKDAFSKVGNIIGVGGSDQDRFIARTQEVYKIFNAPGYEEFGTGITYKDYDIGKSDVDNNQKQPYWYAAFQRLRKYVIDKLNKYNPGLGTDYGKLFPEFKMANEGQMQGQPITALREIVNAIPVQSGYIPGTLQNVLAIDTTTGGDSLPKQQPNADIDKTIAQAVDGYTVIKDAQGKVLQIRDAIGNIINPGSPAYNHVVDKSNTPPEGTKQKAGMGTVVTVLAVAAFIGTVVYMTKDKPKEKQKDAA